MMLLKKKNLAVIPIMMSLVAFVCQAGQSTVMGDDDIASAEETVRRQYEKIKEAATRGNSEALDRALSDALDQLFDLPRLSSQILQQAWLDLSPHDRDRFVEALRKSMKQGVTAELQKLGTPLPSLGVDVTQSDEKAAGLDLALEARGHEIQLSLSLLKHPDGVWRISNAKSSDKNLRNEYYSFCKNLIEDCSFAYMVGELANDGYVVLEDFEGNVLGTLPTGWKWKGSDDDKNKPYEIREENGNKYLAAEDNGESVILGKDVKWNLKKYPYISFRWRVHKIPEGGDERYGNKNDSGAAIYIIYKKKFGLIPETVKYLWSTTLEVGAYCRRSGTGRPWNVVVESGYDHLGEWRSYTFNAYQAYKDTFGGNPPDKTEGIGILSDANSVRSQAYADYDDIRVLKEADAGSGARKKLKAE